MPPPERTQDAEARRRARSTWRVRVLRLGDDDAEPMGGTIAERLAAVEELTRQAWALAGLPMPTYDRAHMPVRIIPLHEDDG